MMMLLLLAIYLIGFVLTYIATTLCDYLDGIEEDYKNGDVVIFSAIWVVFVPMWLFMIFVVESRATLYKIFAYFIPRK